MVEGEAGEGNEVDILPRHELIYDGNGKQQIRYHWPFAKLS